MLKRILEEGLNSVFARLHKGVSHAHLVKLFSYFEDSNFVYIVLELCRYCLLLYWWSIFHKNLNICWFKKTCRSTVCSQKEKSDGVAQEA